MDLLPTPVAQPSGNTPEEHLRKKPGRVVVTDLAIIAENGLIPSGGQLLPTPSANVGSNGGSQHPDKRRAGNHQPSIQDVAEHVLLPTPRATDGPKGGPNQRGSSGDMMLPSAVMHLPTPRATRGGSGTETMYLLGAERSDDDRPQGQVLLPTPNANGDKGDGRLHKRGNPTLRGAVEGTRASDTERTGINIEALTGWGPYEPAIRRWEAVLGRPAPSPTEPNKNGNPRLSPAFCEWMMGVPEGWITSIPISRNEQLKACGNGVVPQQAAAALGDMLAAFGEREAAA